MTSVGLLDHPKIAETLSDPATSHWLRQLLRELSNRDPVDALNDVTRASQLLRDFVDDLLRPTASKAGGRVCTFRVQVNDGPEHDLPVSSGFYVSAVAAVPAVLGVEDFPVHVRIWIEQLQPHYPPMIFAIDEPGGPVRRVSS